MWISVLICNMYSLAALRQLCVDVDGPTTILQNPPEMALESGKGKAGGSFHDILVWTKWETNINAKKYCELLPFCIWRKPRDSHSMLRFGVWIPMFGATNNVRYWRWHIDHNSCCLFVNTFVFWGHDGFQVGSDGYCSPAAGSRLDSTEMTSLHCWNCRRTGEISKMDFVFCDEVCWSKDSFRDIWPPDTGQWCCLRTALWHCDPLWPPLWVFRFEAWEGYHCCLFAYGVNLRNRLVEGFLEGFSSVSVCFSVSHQATVALRADWCWKELFHGWLWCQQGLAELL